MKHQDDIQNQVKIQPEHKRRHAALPQALVRMYTLILPILLLMLLYFSMRQVCICILIHTQGHFYIAQQIHALSLSTLWHLYMDKYALSLVWPAGTGRASWK